MTLPMYQESSITHILAIASGKGGVGKSTVTVNLALALKEKGFSVGILDADVYGPSIRKMLKEEKRPGQRGEKFVPAESHGIALMTMGYFRKEGDAAAVRAPIANKIIAQFVNQVIWGKLDFLLVDYPPGTGDVQLTLSQQLPLTGAIMVTTPQEVATIDVAKGIDFFNQLSVPLLGIVENMSYFEADDKKFYPFGQGGAESLSKMYHLPLLEKIPIAEEVSRCSDRGSSLLENSKEFQELFSRLVIKITENLFPIENHSIELKNNSQIVFRKDSDSEFIVDVALLQKACPCAGCVSEKTVLENVLIKGFEKVGRAAYRFSFSSGCSYGIYDVNLLEKLGSKTCII